MPDLLRTLSGGRSDRGSFQRSTTGPVDLIRREEAHRRRADDGAAEPDPVGSDPAEQVVEEIGLPEERAAVRRAIDSGGSERLVALYSNPP
jgi:hypothetical protein